MRAHAFYWRNADQREVDVIDEESDTLRAYETKLDPIKSAHIPLALAGCTRFVRLIS